MAADSQGAHARRGGAESIILIITLVKGLIDTVIAIGVPVVIIGNAAFLVVLIVIVIVVALSKGLVVAIMLP